MPRLTQGGGGAHSLQNTILACLLAAGYFEANWVRIPGFCTSENHLKSLYLHRICMCISKTLYSVLCRWSRSSYSVQFSKTVQILVPCLLILLCLSFHVTDCETHKFYQLLRHTVKLSISLISVRVPPEFGRDLQNRIRFGRVPIKPNITCGCIYKSIFRLKCVFWRDYSLE